MTSSDIEAAIFRIEGIHHFHGNACLCGFVSSRSRSRTEHITGLVRAAFEQAQKPGDDEREALAQAVLDSERLRQLAEWQGMDCGNEDIAHRLNRIADRIDRLAARRPVQGEPSDTYADHNSWVHGWNAAVEAMSEHPGEWEPTTRQVKAAHDAFAGASTGNVWPTNRAMRAALRAVFTTQGGENRG